MAVFSQVQLWSRAGLIGISAVTLAACSPEFQLGGSGEVAPALSTRLAQADATALEVEAPDVYFSEERGLWDGRPSLGGVWIAHTEASDPQRVLITNQTNGETVVGALFRRERDNFGPPFMISSDAAAALNVVAGQPTDLTVVALRRNEIPAELNITAPLPDETTSSETTMAEGNANSTALPAPMQTRSLEATTLASAPATAATPTAASASALDVATLAQNALALASMSEGDVLADTQSTSVATAAPAPIATAAPAPVAPASATPVAETLMAAARPNGVLERPYIQIGLYAVEANANRAAQVMRDGGVVPTVRHQASASREFWRVIVGPAQNSRERAALLETIRGMGYEDAYFVTN